MRLGLIGAALFVLACAGAAAQPPQPLWRQHTEHLAADREIARACLTARGVCESAIQSACFGGAGDRPGAAERQCDWRAIAAWEDEMNALLAELREHLGGRDVDNLDASQRAWEASMLADVGLGMGRYEGGSLAGPVGAAIRARATAQRAIFLHDLRQME